MFLKKIALLLIPVILPSIFALFLVFPVAAYSASPGKTTVVIDAGHGGADGGVTGVNTKVKEADINLAVANELKKLFEAAGFNAVMTRTTSAGLYGAFSSGFKLRDLKERVSVAERSKADIFVSVHMNKYSDGSRRGAQVFYKAGDEKSKLLAAALQDSFNKMEGAPRVLSELAGDYYVLNYSPCPAVICECGYLSNPEDEALLTDENYRGKLAYALFSGCVEYFAALDENGLRATIGANPG